METWVIFKNCQWDMCILFQSLPLVPHEIYVIHWLALEKFAKMFLVDDYVRVLPTGGSKITETSMLED